eukprot:6105407-Amphidinium_carterae.1
MCSKHEGHSTVDRAALTTHSFRQLSPALTDSVPILDSLMPPSQGAACGYTSQLRPPCMTPQLSLLGSLLPSPCSPRTLGPEHAAHLA